MTAATLEALALTGIRLARDKMRWTDEVRACAFAAGWMVGRGADTDRAARAVAKVWASKIEATDPI